MLINDALDEPFMPFIEFFELANTEFLIWCSEVFIATIHKECRINISLDFPAVRQFMPSLAEFFLYAFPTHMVILACSEFSVRHLVVSFSKFLFEF